MTSRLSVTWLAAASVVGLIGAEACSSSSSTNGTGTGATASTSTGSNASTSGTGAGTSTGGTTTTGSATGGTTTGSATGGTTTSSTGTGAGTDGGTDGGDGGVPEQEIVYTENNDPAGNGVHAFKHNPDGSLSQITGSPFSAGGMGLTNTAQVLGPEDSDQEVIVDTTTKRLFAVNGGSSTIAVFDIQADGSLTAVAGSPFPSGGTNPVSLGLAVGGSVLYVVNKAIDATLTPSYVALKVAADGSLSALTGAGASVTAPLGASPTQAYVSPDGKHLFGTDFFGPTLTPAEGTLRSFVIGTTGLLTAGATDPVTIPTDPNFPVATAPPLALGLVAHPTQAILYANFVTRGEVATYTFDATGTLTYVGATATTGPAPCWLTTSADGLWLYAVNTGDASVSVLDLSTPKTPTLKQHFAMLNTTGTSFVDASGKAQTVTSAAFQEHLSKDGKTLYVIGQRVTTLATDTTSPGNQIHALVVAADGTVSEPNPPTALSLSVAARAQGVSVFTP